MAWLVRVAISDVDADATKEMAYTLRQLNDRRPAWVAQMRELSRIEMRQHLRANGLSFDTFQGLPLGGITLPPELLAVPERYCVKLGKALYYMHTKRIVPALCLVKTHVYPNSEFLSGKFPLDKFDLLASVPPISRSGKSLASQFAYRFGIAADGGGAGFLLQFGESFAAAVLVFEDAQEYELRQSARHALDATDASG